MVWSGTSECCGGFFSTIFAVREECSSWILMVPASKRNHALGVHHALPEPQCAFSPNTALCTQLI
jgi:hypothetical protein